MRKGKYPDPYLWQVNLDHGGPKACETSGSGYPPHWQSVFRNIKKPPSFRELFWTWYFFSPLPSLPCWGTFLAGLDPYPDSNAEPLTQLNPDYVRIWIRNTTYRIVQCLPISCERSFMCKFVKKIFANFTFNKHRLFLKILYPAILLCPSLILKSFEPSKL
jgi:hypothetical protein